MAADVVDLDGGVYSRALIERLDGMDELSVMEETIALETEGEALLDEVCASETFSKEELPTPSVGNSAQGSLLGE